MADHRPQVGPLQPESVGDNLRVYLKEMGLVPLLTRQAEVVLARQMERGMRRIIGSLAQHAVVEQELRLLDDQIRQRSLSPECYFECEGMLQETRRPATKSQARRAGIPADSLGRRAPERDRIP
jgi:RNA polymerase primary sigma factor